MAALEISWAGHLVRIASHCTVCQADWRAVDESGLLGEPHATVSGTGCQSEGEQFMVRSRGGKMGLPDGEK
jgi:hypothetical protein